MRGRGPTVVLGAWMSILRGERRGESCGGGIGLSSAPAGSEIGPASASVTDSPETRGALGFEGPRDDLRQEHHQGS